jgi:hypothetical protein
MAAAPGYVDPATAVVVAATPPADPAYGPPADYGGSNNDPAYTSGHGGLFAPAYIHGYGASERAVNAWNAAKGGLTRDMIDSLRMPAEWTPPSGKAPGDGVYGGSNIPLTLKLGQDGGLVDPAALRALSHGTAYDVGARRDAIAARMLANQQAQDAYGGPTPMGRGELAQTLTYDPATGGYIDPNDPNKVKPFHSEDFG